MTKDESTLLSGAELHWAGSGEHLLAVYLCLKKAESMGWFWAGATIKSLLLDPPDRRASTIAELRARVEHAKPARKGPRMDRYQAAIAGLDALAQLDRDSPA